VKKFLFLPTLLAMAVTVGAFAQTSKMAFVDSEIILRDLPEAQQASKDLETMVKPWQDEFEKMRLDLQKQIEDYQKQRSLMPVDRRESEEQRLGQLQQKATEFFSKKLDPRTGEVVAEREKKLAPIREKILKTIEVVAKEEGFTFVVDRSNILYGDAKADLTYKVLDRLKRGTTATPARPRN
jgi:outer membrane protein